MIALAYAGPDEDCGCRVEEYDVGHIWVQVHYEDGRADAYAYIDPDCGMEADATFPAPTVFAGRLSVLKWVRGLLS